MKIHHDVTHSLQQAGKSAPSRGASTGFVRPASQNDVDSVSLSPASRSLANGVAGKEAPFDAKRVEAIKAAISSGQFKVDPTKVADQVIDSASQLLGS